jgi:hypothetical protein
MAYREIIGVCFRIHTKHINTQCGQHVEFVNVKPGGTYSNHWVLEGWTLLMLVTLFWCVAVLPVTTSRHCNSAFIYSGLQSFSHFLNKPVCKTAQREGAFKEQQLLTKFP